jgi:hypothetical protein
VIILPRAPVPRRRSASRALPALALAVLALLGPHACGAAGRGGPGRPPGGRRGPILPTLPDGTPVEPSVYRAETTESAEVLEDGVLDWEVEVAGGAVDRLGSLRTNALECVHAEARRGFGDGLELSARAESWNHVAVEQGSLPQSAPESGYGPTTLTVRERLRAGGRSGPSACAGLRLRLPGGANGPDTHVVEGGVFVPVSFPLGKQTRLGAMVEGDIVPDALDSGRHLEAVTSLELSREFGARLSARCEAVGVRYGEPGRPWLGSLNAGVSVDLLSHVGLTLGAAGGLRAGQSDLGCFGRLSVHP